MFSEAQRYSPATEDSGLPFEQLAEESGCPRELVVDLYERELVLLEDGARIRSYIPVLAMKRVRAALRGKRSTHRRALVTPAAAKPRAPLLNKHPSHPRAS